MCKLDANPLLALTLTLERDQQLDAILQRAPPAVAHELRDLRHLLRGHEQRAHAAPYRAEPGQGQGQGQG